MTRSDPAGWGRSPGGPAPLSSRDILVHGRPVVRRILASALLGVLLVAATAGCGEPAPPSPTWVPTQAPATPEARLVVTASVLITEKPEEPTATIATISVSPSSLVLDPGDSAQLKAEVLGPDGQVLSDIELVWSAADPRAGTVTREGLLQAGTAPGVFEDSISVTGIQNTPEGIRYASASVSVTVVGQAEQPKLASVGIMPPDPTVLRRQLFRLHAVGYDQDGVVIPGVRFVWKLNETNLGRLNELGLLTVEGEEGKYSEAVSVTGIWEGARSSTTTDIAVISVPRSAEVVNVHALPQRFYLQPGDRMQLRAVALNGLGELV